MSDEELSSMKEWWDKWRQQEPRDYFVSCGALDVGRLVAELGLARKVVEAARVVITDKPMAMDRLYEALRAYDAGVKEGV